MRIALTACLAALLLGLTSVTPGYAQGANQATTPSVPITKILAIGTINPGADTAAGRGILPREVRETVDLYLDGKIDQWFSLQERVGVAFILNVTDVAAAREMLEKLPLGQAHIMSFELIPLGPLNPLRQLQGMKSGTQ
jgi:hypothetical protein